MKYLLILIPLFLSGCATTQGTQTVYVPVATKCYDKPIPSKPKLNVDSMKGDEKVDVIINNLTTDIDKLEVYSDELKTFICK